MTDLQADLDRVLPIAADAADTALSFFHRGVEWIEKNPRDLVSVADRTVEDLLRDRLATAFAEDALVGEEGAGTHLDDLEGRRRWYVDPIDGTTNFLKGLPSWGISIGLADADDDLLLGVVVLPVTGEVYTAVRGGGARRNGTPIRCSEVTELDHTLVTYALTPRASDTWGGIDVPGVFRSLVAVSLGTRMQGCSVADLTSVATGRIDATIAGGMSKWDVAAGLLIAREAGVRVTRPDGSPSTGPDLAFVACPPGVHDALWEVIEQNR